MGIDSLQELLVNEAAEILIYMKHSKSKLRSPSFIPPSPSFPKKKRSRQITLQGIRDFKAIEEQGRLLFQQTSRLTLQRAKNGRRNKRKGKISSRNKGRSSAKRIQTDGPVLSPQSKFKCVERSGTKLIFRKVDQCSASIFTPVSTAASASLTLQVGKTPITMDLNFPPPVDD